MSRYRIIRFTLCAFVATLGVQACDNLVTDSRTSEDSPDRAVLMKLYDVTNGPGWTNNDGWGSDAPLRTWHGVTTDGLGRVLSLNLSGTETARGRWLRQGLVGPIPPELGNLTRLSRLNLEGNDLNGPIPPELGKLSSLATLDLSDNSLTGQIPPELGDLDELAELDLSDNELSGPIPVDLTELPNLRWLFLSQNDLSGEIPPELGDLAELVSLGLSHNNLTGSIPPELGNLANLWSLHLASNGLSGSVPPEMGGVANARILDLTNNRDLAGALPLSLTGLDRLAWLLADGTGLCAPTDAAFKAWLDRVFKQRVAPCAEPSAAYLTQAVQSREFPVPLVAGQKALLRVFPTARQATSEGLPLVRAQFYVGGRETYVQDVPSKSDPIPTEVAESDLARSANAEIAGWVIQPGLEMVIEVDPDSTLDPELGVTKRIPETGRHAVAVKTMPRFDLTLIPFVWTQTHDSSIVDLVTAMAADPEHHEMLGDVNTLLPIGAFGVTAHEGVLSSSNNAYTLLAQTKAIRAMEGGTGHYMGMMSRPRTGPDGLAERPGRSSFSHPVPGTIAHELGHNLSLRHAPCGGPGSLDASYPYPNGSIGAWGYEFRDGGRLVRPSTPELMSYCGPKWISDYHFTNALHYRLFDEGAESVEAVAASKRSLLLWGGVGADSEPFLEPAFVIDAAATLPDSAGEYRVVGRAADGDELFSSSFTMPEIADGDGSSNFAFALPVQAGWDRLETITLSGPEGSVTLDRDSDIPMAVLRDPHTGEVRGILHDPPAVTEVTAEGVGTLVSGLEVLFSRGIPGIAAWRR